MIESGFTPRLGTSIHQREILVNILQDSTCIVRSICYPEGVDIPGKRLDNLKVVYEMKLPDGYWIFVDWYDRDGNTVKTTSEKTSDQYARLYGREIA